MSAEFEQAITRWRKLSRPLWRKHNRARRHMMHWAFLPGRKARIRRKKWARQYERTLIRMPNPPQEPEEKENNKS